MSANKKAMANKQKIEMLFNGIKFSYKKRYLNLRKFQVEVKGYSSVEKYIKVEIDNGKIETRKKYVGISKSRVQVREVM